MKKFWFYLQYFLYIGFISTKSAFAYSESAAPYDYAAAISNAGQGTGEAMTSLGSMQDRVMKTKTFGQMDNVGAKIINRVSRETGLDSEILENSEESSVATVGQVDKVAATNSDAANNGEKTDGMESAENKMLSGLSIGAAGIGGMQLASGLAEKSADESAARDRNAYMATFRCRVGDDGSHVAHGQTYGIPGYSAEFISLAGQYRALAEKTRITKEALGLKPGIESEEILDTSTLYINEPAVAQAKVFDTASERLESGAAANKIKTGAIVAGVGVVGGIVGDAVINKDATPNINSGAFGGAGGMIQNNQGLIPQGMNVTGGILGR
jgi:hypothetical protein